jgi:hypothetical protein
MVDRDETSISNLSPGAVAVFLVVLLVAVLGFAMYVAKRESIQRGVTASPETVTREEQLAVYRAALRDWILDGRATISLQIQTVPLEIGRIENKNCGEGFDLEPDSPAAIDRFQKADLGEMGSDRMVLADPQYASQVLAKRGLRMRKLMGQGAGRGILGGTLLTLSRIRFDRENRHAILSYSYACGGDCGKSETVVVEKVNGQWSRTRACVGWVM